MKKTGMSHIERAHEGATNDWWTPRELVEALGRFDLDPCAGLGQTPLAKNVIVLPQDGLLEDWQGRVYCNPPYGPHVRAWAEKIALHGNGILLIFARVETRAWREIWQTADAILFPFRRITFEKPDGTQAKSGTAPSAFCAYGAANVEALRHSGIEGALVEYVSITTPERVDFLFGGEDGENIRRSESRESTQKQNSGALEHTIGAGQLFPRDEQR